MRENYSRFPDFEILVSSLAWDCALPRFWVVRVVAYDEDAKCHLTCIFDPSMFYGLEIFA